MADKLPSQYMDLIFSCEGAELVHEKDKKKLGKMGETPVHDFVRNSDEDKIEKIEYEACCNCVPCRTIISSNYYGKGYFPESYKKNLYDNSRRTLERAGFKVIDERTGAAYLKQERFEEECRTGKIQEKKSKNKKYEQMEIDFDAAVAPEHLKKAYQEYLERLNNGEDERTVYAETMAVANRKAKEMGMSPIKIIDCNCDDDVCTCNTEVYKDKYYLDDDDEVFNKAVDTEILISKG